MADKVRIAIVGLGFGAEFIPIFQAHPNAEMYAICRRNKAELDKVGDRTGAGALLAGSLCSIQALFALLDWV